VINEIYKRLREAQELDDNELSRVRMEVRNYIGRLIPGIIKRDVKYIAKIATKMAKIDDMKEDDLEEYILSLGKQMYKEMHVKEGRVDEMPTPSNPEDIQFDPPREPIDIPVEVIDKSIYAYLTEMLSQIHRKVGGGHRGAAGFVCKDIYSLFDKDK